MAETKTIVLAGGCFWCLQPPFDNAEGVIKTVVGYAGGTKETAHYEAVGHGNTGHREAIEVTYDDAKITHSELLDIFFNNTDPTDAGGQFVDRGFQYTSALYFHTPEEKAANAAAIEKWEKKLGKKIATVNEPAKAFYAAEDYHQDYYQKNPLRYNAYKYGSGRK